MASLISRIRQKLNPAQPVIAQEEGKEKSSTQSQISTVQTAYNTIEIVNRVVNATVDNAAMIEYDVKDSFKWTGVRPNVRPDSLKTLLNSRPNPYMDRSTFWRLVLMDFLLDGNAFIHYDGTSLYHVPADGMKIITDSKGYINSFEYNDNITYKVNEIIFIKDNSADSVYRGDSRVNSALNSLVTRDFMLEYQKAYFKSGTSIGLIIETDDIMNDRMKERLIRQWMRDYNPTKSTGKPFILDNGAKAKAVSNSNFREMGFTEAMESFEKEFCVAMGFPHILADSGNNANLRPNIELWFHTTILPMLHKFERAIEHFFGIDVELTTHKVPSLQPDRKIQAEYLSALVNNGLMLGREAREILRLDALPDEEVLNKIRIPANVAGSTTGVSGEEGGAPPKKE